MKITDVIPEADILIALEPDELGLRLLKWIATLSASDRTLTYAVYEASQTYRRHDISTVSMAIREAWAWLEGSALLVESSKYKSPSSIRELSRRAVRIAKENDPLMAFRTRHIPKEALHPSIREDVWSLYHRGKYDTAVFEAMKAVEVAVREAAVQPASLVGVKLMRFAFAPDGGPLSDMSADAGERVARMELFAGSIGSYKNPHSHRNIMLNDSDEAAEIIMMANHLLRIVTARVAAKVAAS